MKRPWVAIVWFGTWGLFQAYAVASVFNGTWARPDAFPEEAYNALVYPDLVFIPLYLAATLLMLTRHQLGLLLGLICGGAVTYAMVYLLVLSGFRGTMNLTFDFAFLLANILAVLQILSRLRNQRELEGA